MRRVLLVDDSVLIRNSIQFALEAFGLEIDHAENGQLAVEKVVASNYDLVFLDVVMPVMDGPTALGEIRKRGHRTPVVLTTSISKPAVVAAALKLGGVQYIAKPFTRELIRSVALKMLKLDASTIPAPSVLVYHAEPILPMQVRKALPAHVAIEAAQTLTQLLDLAESAPRDVVLLDTQGTGEDLADVACNLREFLPAAAMFALRDGAERPWWQPDAELDGTLPRELGESIARGFLLPNFLRPLASLDGAVLRAAGFTGAPVDMRAYGARLARTIVAHCARLDPSVDLVVDLTRVPDDVDTVVDLVNIVAEQLCTWRETPRFQLSTRVSSATVGKPGQLARIKP